MKYGQATERHNMNTILVPVDSSSASENAALYAAALSADISAKKIILVKSFIISRYTELLSSRDCEPISADDIQEERENSERMLKKLAGKIRVVCGNGVEVKTVLCDRLLLRCVQQMIRDMQPDLLIAGSGQAGTYEGSNGQPGACEESSIGPQIAALAKISPLPVLIIPSETKYVPLKKALVPCDFTAAGRLGSLDYLRNSLTWLRPELSVLNINSKQITASKKKENAALLERFLEGFKFSAFYSDDPDIAGGILRYAESNLLNLIIALPGQHSVFYTFTHKSITDALALNSSIPVLILK